MPWHATSNRAAALFRYTLAGAAVLLAACSSDVPATEPATAGAAATDPPVSAGSGTEQIGSCPLALLTIGREPGDGAGGHALSLISFRNDGPEPCEPTDPLAVETTPVTVPPIGRGRLFIPVERFQGELAPGSVAYIAVENTTCVTGGGSSIESVTVLFEGDVTVTVPWVVASTCGTRWEGFVSWR